MAVSASPSGSASTLREVVDRFDEVIHDVAKPRDEIVASWERCALLGLQPERFVVPYNADIDTGGRLTWAAGSVLDRVGEDLEGTRMGLLLTDQRGQVLVRKAGGRRVGDNLDHIQLAPGFVYGEEIVGTNAIGTAIQRRAESVVQGPEHFAEALMGMACTAICISDPVA